MHSIHNRVVRYNDLQSAKQAIVELAHENTTNYLSTKSLSKEEYSSMYTRLLDILSMNSMVVLSLANISHFGIVVDRSKVLDIPHYMCISEVINYNSARPFIDFDFDITTHIKRITELIVEYYEMLYDVKVAPHWSLSRNLDGSNKKYHCMISGIYLQDCWKHTCIDMSNYIDYHIAGLKIDYSVFRYNSSLRLIGQSKLVDGEHSRRLLPLINNEDNICYNNTSGRWDCDIIVTIHQRIKDRFGNSDSPQLMRRNKVLEYQPQSSTVGLSDEDSNIISDIIIPNEYSIYSIHKYETGHINIRLSREYPSYCKMCNKIHNRENAYVVVYAKNNYILKCFARSTSNKYVN